VVVIGYNKNSHRETMLLADPGYSAGLYHEVSVESFVGAWSFETDMLGKPMSNDWIVTALRAAEVYPNTMIVPKQSFIKDI
jgi:hypothetical protein